MFRIGDEESMDCEIVFMVVVFESQAIVGEQALPSCGTPLVNYVTGTLYDRQLPFSLF
jgi:hypothetical protein